MNTKTTDFFIAAIGEVDNAGDLNRIIRRCNRQLKSLTPATPAAPTKFLLDPGEQVVFEVTDIADTAGTGMIFVEYELEGFSGGLPAPALTLANRTSNMTKNE